MSDQVMAPPVVRAFEHIGVMVGELARSVAWYEDILEAVQVATVSNNQIDEILLTLGDADIQIIRDAASPADPFDLKANEVGAYTICVRVGDLAAFAAKLRQRRVSGVSELMTDAGALESVLFQDPDGVQLKAVQAAGPGGRAECLVKGLDHIALTVSDLDRSARWYERFVGLHFEGDSRGPSSKQEGGVATGGELQSRRGAVGGFYLELREWADAGSRPSGMKFNGVGSMHLCFDLVDPPAASDRLAAAGEEISYPLSRGTLGRGLGGWVFISRDPDKNFIQICEMAPR